jgi:methyltransferase (TIGR00027 family)
LYDVEMQIRPSYTAETVALQRSFENNEPEGRRLFSDPFASSFLHGRLRLLAQIDSYRWLKPVAERLFDLFGGPGPRPSAILRTRAIDDVVAGALKSRSQFVLLGAGYDTRPYRLMLPTDVVTFEVDLPATQDTKRRVLEAHGVHRGAVRFVAVDFESDDVGAALEASGLDPSQPSIVVWEGVTQYLTADAVDQTFAALARICSTGSRLVLTYVDVAALNPGSPFPEAKRWLRNVSRAGEPWIFGIDPADASHFFEPRGFTLVCDQSTAEIGLRLAGGNPPRLHGSRLYRVAVLDRLM